jgi:tetratricopeptide (TPR) repeat protein
VLLLSFHLGCAYSAVKIKKIQVTPENINAANAKLREGDILLAKKEFYPALLRYLEASKLNPSSEIIYNKLGIAYSQLMLYREAIAALNTAIALNKHYAYAYNNLGSVHFALRELRPAEKNFKRAIKLNPNVASFHQNLGAVYFEKKNYQHAKDEYRIALTLDKNVLSRSDAISLKAPGESQSNPMRNYQMAIIYASILQDVDKTIEHLKLAADQGYRVLDFVDKEPSFDPVRNDPRFKNFLEDLRILSLP